MQHDGEGERESGARSFVRRWGRALLSEVLSTAFIMVVGLWALVPRLREERLDEPMPWELVPRLDLEPPPLAHVALSFGFAVLAAVQVFGPASGAHMNPAVSLAAALLGRLAPLGALAYCGAQLLGATLGFGALRALVPAAAARAPFGCTLPGPGVGAPAALGIELLLTALLVLVVCSFWTAPAPDPAAPIKLGLVFAGLVYSGGYLTGASLNPARSLGPAIIQNTWDAHWVYWAGPLLGAALAALLHRYVLMTPPPPPPPAPHPEAAPLRDQKTAEAAC